MKQGIRVFQMVDTQGLPLAVIIDRLHESGMAVCMPEFIADARAAGWTDRKIRSTVTEALADVHGQACRPLIDRSLSLILGEPGEAGQ